MPLLGSTSGVLWGSWGKSELINTSRVLVSSLRVLSMGHHGKEFRGRGGCLTPRHPGEEYKKPTHTCDSVGCYLRHAFQGRAGVSSRPL